MPLVKLTDQQKARAGMVALYENGHTLAQIAALYGVHKSRVYQLLTLDPDFKLRKRGPVKKVEEEAQSA